MECKVLHCENDDLHGTFTGEFCNPCYEFITKGTGVHSQAYRNQRIIEFDDTVESILGRPNFTCGRIANRLRDKGHTIKCKAENEQAAVLYWMLSNYIQHGKEWNKVCEEYLK